MSAQRQLDRLDATLRAAEPEMAELRAEMAELERLFAELAPEVRAEQRRARRLLLELT